MRLGGVHKKVQANSQNEIKRGRKKDWARINGAIPKADKERSGQREGS